MIGRETEENERGGDGTSPSQTGPNEDTAGRRVKTRRITHVIVTVQSTGARYAAQNECFGDLCKRQLGSVVKPATILVE